MARGKKTGGRRAGSADKAPAAARELAALQFASLQEDFERWVREVADGWTVVELDGQGMPVERRVKRNPGEAARLTLALAEFNLPRLARTELTGGDGGPVQVEVRRYVKAPSAPAPAAVDEE